MGDREMMLLRNLFLIMAGGKRTLSTLMRALAWLPGFAGTLQV